MAEVIWYVIWLKTRLGASSTATRHAVETNLTRVSICLFCQSITKYASVGNNADSIELVRGKSKGMEGHSIGIAHTRWATHGACAKKA